METFKIEAGRFQYPHQWRYVARVKLGEPLPQEVLDLWDTEAHQQRAINNIPQIMEATLKKGDRAANPRMSCGSTALQYLRITRL